MICNATYGIKITVWSALIVITAWMSAEISDVIAFMLQRIVACYCRSMISLYEPCNNSGVCLYTSWANWSFPWVAKKC